MSKNEIGEDSPIPKFLYLKIRRRDGVESMTTLEEGEFKVPIDSCIRSSAFLRFLYWNESSPLSFKVCGLHMTINLALV